MIDFASRNGRVCYRPDPFLFFCRSPRYPTDFSSLHILAANSSRDTQRLSSVITLTDVALHWLEEINRAT